MENKWIPRGSETLLSYYDISSAEVRAAAAESLDPELNRLFREKIDVYVNTAVLFYPDFHSLSKKEQGVRRKQFKTVFLGHNILARLIRDD